MPITYDDIASFLAPLYCADLPESEPTASVAMILGKPSKELELLLMQRTIDRRDPWSGNLAFPGGRIKKNENPRRAAERETLEEVGLKLRNSRCLGRLPDISGAHLPVNVACFVYALENGEGRTVRPNHEVHDVFWIGVDQLAAPQRHIVATVTFDGKKMKMPAISIPRPGIPVLWGLTYRMVVMFLEAVGMLPSDIRMEKSFAELPEKRYEHGYAMPLSSRDCMNKAC